jgi:hypothetical protein
LHIPLHSIEPQPQSVRSLTFVERGVGQIPERAADVAKQGDPAQVRQATEIAELAEEIN